ncbi:hypothetical protein O6H91_Y361500 [Diphasiastrum complanatum]|nr:hypothetical protein O6H91_Y361500 [Diphasiastrum complanatum]
MSTITESRVENMLAQVRHKSQLPLKNTQQLDEGNTKILNRLPAKFGQQPEGDSACSSITDLENDKENSRLREKQHHFQASPTSKPMMEFKKKLPAFKLKSEILQAVAKSQVLIVSGETGCGKTTQLPQFILETEIEAGRGLNCNIICTQPRRISTISVAARVAAERGEVLGDTIGFQIRLEAKRSKHTRLLFCTTGVLLRRLVQDPELKGVSHVIVDEIHERGMNEDFLLIILRDLLPHRPDVRLVLMSATINAEAFSSYFDNAPLLHIPGFTFPVKELFLEDVLEITRHVITNEQSAVSSFRHGVKKKLQEKKNDFLINIFEEVDIQSEYKNYGKTTRESLQAWNGEKIDLDLIAAYRSLLVHQTSLLLVDRCLHQSCLLA